VNRAVIAGHLYEATIPSVALAWMERLNYGISTELKSAVARLGIPVADWQTLFEHSTQRADSLEAELREFKNQHSLTTENLENLRAEYRKLHTEAVGSCQYLEQELVERDERIAELEALLQDAKKTNLGSKLGSLTRKNATLAKLLFAMARGGYGEKGNIPGSKLISAVQSDCDEMGVPLDAKTIRTHLSDAFEGHWHPTLKE
jgi:DNA repair exonuclease SbcCD ATPase subunit